MKYFKSSMLLLWILMLSIVPNESIAQDQASEYAVVMAAQRGLSKGYRIEVDLGDTAERIKVGKEWSEALDKVESLAEVLNYMSTKGYEFLESTITYTTVKGSGGGEGVILIFRRKP